MLKPKVEDTPPTISRREEVQLKVAQKKKEIEDNLTFSPSIHKTQKNDENEIIGKSTYVLFHIGDELDLFSLLK